MSRTQHGWTLLSMVAAIALFSQTLILAIHTVKTTSDLDKSTRERSRAALLHGRNIDAVVNVLLPAAEDTLDNFDPLTGITAEPQFERVTGEVDGARTLSGFESLEWRAAPQPVPGVASPGAIFHVTASGDRLVAAQVVGGTFSVRLEGRMLAVAFTTFSTGRMTGVILVPGGSSIMIRNEP